MRLLLIDGTNLVMRFAHAMVPGGDIADHPVVLDALPIIMSACNKAIHECAKVAHCTHAVVALDSGVESWRKQLYPEYKAKRTDVTLTWSNRFAVSCAEREVYAARWPGEEADDVLATIAARVGRAGKQCVVLSSDNDLLQLASLWCSVYQYGRKGEPKFVARPMRWITDKYGLAHVGQLAAYKSLVGDPSDNLPGIKGVGPKKAQELLRNFPVADDLARSGYVNAEQFALMLDLVTLRDNLPLDPIQPSACRL